MMESTSTDKIEVVRFILDGMPDLILSKEHILENYNGNNREATEDYGITDDVIDALNETIDKKTYEELSAWEG